MDNQKIIDSVVTKVKDAGFKPASISKPEDCDVIVRFRDVQPPHMATSVKVTGEEIAAYGAKVGGEAIDPKGKKLEEVVRTRVRHAVQQLDNMRPVELAAQARRKAEGGRD